MSSIYPAHLRLSGRAGGGGGGGGGTMDMYASQTKSNLNVCLCDRINLYSLLFFYFYLSEHDSSFPG